MSLQQKHTHCHTLAGDLLKDDTSWRKFGSCLDRKGSFRYSKSSSLSGRKKEMGEMSFWVCCGKTCRFHLHDFHEFPGTFREKKNPLLSQTRSLLWFRCIYTSICLKLFFSCLHSVPCSCSVSWNSSASMSRCVWWCSRARWKECSVQVSSKGSADYSQKMWWLLGLCADQIMQKSSWKWVLRKIKINLSKGHRGAPSSVLQPKCPHSNFHGPYLTGVLYFKTF